MVWLSSAIRNSVALICWIILAIHFNKWWIALFAYFFMTSIEQSNSSSHKEKNE